MTEAVQGLDNEGFDPNSWENLDESQIKDEVMGMIKRINKLSEMLDKMVVTCDYEETSKIYYKAITDDFGPSSFVRLFYDNNKSVFGNYPNEDNCPPWYSGLKPDQKKSFDECHHYFIDFTYLVKILQSFSMAMLDCPLEDAYKYMVSVVTFSEVDFTEDFYGEINGELIRVSGLLNTNWKLLNDRARDSLKYIDQSLKGDGKPLEQTYRELRKKDYRTELDVAGIKKFTMQSNGRFTCDPGFMADMKVIDSYTRELTKLSNVKEGMEKMQSYFPQIGEQLNVAWDKTKTGHAKALIDALYKLRDVLNDFAKGGINVYECYKNHDTDAPYVFVRPLPAYGMMTGVYGLKPRTNDPAKDGTDYYNLYKEAEKALEQHCEEYVYKKGWTIG